MEDGGRMALETGHQYVNCFVGDVCAKLGPICLNPHPSKAERFEIEHHYSPIGFPGSVSSLDCCHVGWL